MTRWLRCPERNTPGDGMVPLRIGKRPWPGFLGSSKNYRRRLFRTPDGHLWMNVKETRKAHEARMTRSRKAELRAGRQPEPYNEWYLLIDTEESAAEAAASKESQPCRTT